MAVKVFLLGRPGSGKTTAFYIIEKIAHKKKKKALRFREYTILRDMARQEDYKDKFRLIEEYDGFDILDTSVFIESARLLEKQIQSHISASKENELIFIELARDDYSQAMNCFSHEFLKDAYIFFFEADLETCIKRIHYRVAHPRKTDGHYVSDYILKSYYSKDNLPYMEYKFRLDYNIQKRVMIIENTDSFKKFAKKTKDNAKFIFAWEFSDTEETVTQEFSNIGETGLNPLQVLMFILVTFPLFILAIPTFIHIIYILTDIPLFIYLLGIITFVLLYITKYIPSSRFTKTGWLVGLHPNSGKTQLSGRFKGNSKLK